MSAERYSIGSDTWPGLSKLIEECGELLQVGGKLMGTGGDPDHWDGSNLIDRLYDELSDVLGAAAFFAEVNGLDWARLEKRADAKAVLFAQWHLDQPAPEPTQGEQ